MQKTQSDLRTNRLACGRLVKIAEIMLFTECQHLNTPPRTAQSTKPMFAGEHERLGLRPLPGSIHREKSRECTIKIESHANK